MIKKYSFEIFKPDWPRWKIATADFFLNILPLGAAKANKMLKKNGHLRDEVFINKVIDELGHKLEVVNVDALPEKGPVTLVANHPGGADVVATISAIARKRPDHVILANELICVEPVVGIVLPVNTLAKSNKINLELVHKAYKENKVVVFYAAGKNSRYNEDGELRDRKWRPTFLDFAMQYDTPIVILNISGSNADIFYKVSRFREKRPKLKKVPLENIFQLRELVIAKKEAIKLTFSDPVPLEITKQKLNSGEQKEKHEYAGELYDFLYEMDENNLKFNK